MPSEFAREFERAVRAIQESDAILITAGAGMGVDSGMPDFRGPEGFWKAYPAAARRGLRFEQLANPAWFRTDPKLAWGFYGHRRNLYRATTPHEGFAILRQWGEAKPGGYFVFTSNVDGHFQKAGFADGNIVECHGSLDHLQCVEGCCSDIWEADGGMISVDQDSLTAADPLPACAKCGKLARPNVLMFGDGGWISDRSDGQSENLAKWVEGVNAPVVIECGAGTGVPTVRRMSEQLAEWGGTLIRINVREPEVPGLGIGIPMGALAALRELHKCVGE